MVAKPLEKQIRGKLNMQVLEKISKSVELFGDNVAIHSRDGEITYNLLWEQSNKLASWLNDKLGDDKKPVVVFGHKNPLMIVCFLACVKSGRAYCPVDVSMPLERIKAIIEAVHNKVILSTEALQVPGYDVLNLEDIQKGINESQPIGKNSWVKSEDIFYIIFTSGSAGAPKGVQITSENLSRYTDWSVTLGNSSENKKEKVFMNQAPFSFDLSVMDLYTCLVSGGTLYCIDKQLQKDTAKLLEYMKEGHLNYWISTPSFADMCLADNSFNEVLIPGLNAFLFCGEKLTNDTARKLYERFPKVVVVNTYGPTESTVAVSEVAITKEMIEAPKPLPIGKCKPGTEIKIIDNAGNLCKDGEKGEIVIIGNTVSPGYFKNPEKTKEVFCQYLIGGQKVRGYKTGDEGYKEDGMLHYSGRIDLQVKLHGYRIELGDIEANLVQLDGVTAAAVIPHWNGEKIRYLVGFIVSDISETTFEDRKRVREGLKAKLPEYMVPKKIVFINQLPITNNGKTDRKKLEEYL